MCFFHPFLLKNWRGKCHVGVRGLTALDWRIIATTDLQAAPIHWCSPDTCLLKPKNHYKEVILVIILNFLCWIQCTAIWITMFYISPHRCNRLLSLHQRDFLFSVAAPVAPALAGFMSFLVFSQGSPLLFFSPLICQVFFFCMGHDLLLFQAVKPAETFSGLIEINLTWLQHALHTQGDTHKHTFSDIFTAHPPSWLPRQTLPVMSDLTSLLSAARSAGHRVWLVWAHNS